MIDTGNIHPKSQGKILQLDYDFITSLEGECMYCLTDAQVQMVLGMLDYIGWPTRWFSSTGTVDYETILALQGNLGRALMTGCCDEPILGTKTDPDTGQILVTTDGTTWIPAEPLGLDPRYTAPQLPPLPDAGSVDNRCRAATNVVAAMDDKIEDFGTQLGSFGTILALASAIALAIVGVWASAGTILPAVIPIVVALAQAIYDLTTEDYLGLFSSGVYDDLQCILYCNCGEDGTFTEQNVLDILTAIDSTFSGNVALTFSSTVKGWQVPGLNAAARGGSLSTGDCSDCDCNPPSDVWFVNANNESTPLYADEDGYFTASTGTETPYAGWYGTVWFREPPLTNESPYPNCWRVTDVEWPGIEPGLAGAITCSDGGYESPPLASFCYAAIQWYTAAGAWSVKFKVDDTCP